MTLLGTLGTTPRPTRRPRPRGGKGGGTGGRPDLLSAPWAFVLLLLEAARRAWRAWERLGDLDALGDALEAAGASGAIPGAFPGQPGGDRRTTPTLLPLLCDGVDGLEGVTQLGHRWTLYLDGRPWCPRCARWHGLTWGSVVAVRPCPCPACRRSSA